MDIKNVIKNLSSKELSKRSDAVEEIYKNRYAETAAPLFALLEKESSRALKEKVLFTMENMIVEIDFDIIKQMLYSEKAFVKNGAIALIKKNTALLYGHLAELSQCDDKDVRKFAIDTLCDDDSLESIKIIRQRLKDPEINIVITAVEYLGNLKSNESAKDIENILVKTDNIMLKCTCLEALSQIGQYPKNDMIIKGKIIDNSNPMFIFSYLKYLGTFGDTNVFPVMRKILKDYPGIYIKNVVDAIENILINTSTNKIPDFLRDSLKKAMESASSADKYEIMKLLAKTDGADSLSAARKMLSSDDEMMILAAVEIIGEKGGPEDIDTLESIAADTESDEILEAVIDTIARLKTGKRG